MASRPLLHVDSNVSGENLFIITAQTVPAEIWIAPTDIAIVKDMISIIKLTKIKGPNSLFILKNVKRLLIFDLFL
jgi:hypothetical protein